MIEGLIEQLGSLRARVAGLLGCDAAEVALTGSTTDGVNAVLAALDLRAGDEIVTSDEEHPGLLAPLAVARERHGIRIRVAPMRELAGAVGERTKLVACSHVSWRTGDVVDCGALAEAGAPVLLDGAQGLGAVPVNVRLLGCDFYAASGQKWLCGPNGTGYLYVRAERAAELPPPWPGYGTLADAAQPARVGLPRRRAALRRARLPAEHQLAWALAALDVLEEAGLEQVHERACAQAETLAQRLAESGREVAPRGHSTLVSWRGRGPAGRRGRAWASAASCCATSPARPTCAPRSGPGTTRATSTAC